MADQALLPVGTVVEWNQRETGERKHGVIVLAYHGLFGPTYRCRAHNWSNKWHTTVIGSDLSLSGREAD